MNWFSSDKEEIEVPKPVDPNAWEFLEDESDFNTYRRRVPGGWLVRTVEPYCESEALTFLPDPNHTWKV